jgi:predicted ATP-dependent endonuclease of OLD family
MFISNLAIRNFRNFRNVSLQFKKGVNTIIGENGSGKTNLLYALRLLIDENLPRRTYFNETDFNRSIGPWKGHWIIIQVQFDELDADEELQAIAMHKVGHVEEFDTTKGTILLCCRPRENVRKQLFDFSKLPEKKKDGLDKILSNITLNDYEITYRGRNNVDFSEDDNYRKFVGDFEEIVFPDPDHESSDVYGVRLSNFSISNEVSCTFVKALRDVEEDLKSYRNNPLLNLLRGKEKYISVAKKADIENKVDTLNNDISSLDEVKNVAAGISNSIKEAVGRTYAPNISIQSELPSDIEKLLQSLKMWVGDPDEEGYQGRIWELSLGGANLIYLSLKLLEYEKVKALERVANFLLIEEPEAHIHTHIQKSLFQKLDKRNTQVIISTHSTHISSVSQISSVNILSRSNQSAWVFCPSNGLQKKEISRIERYLDAVRSTLLFAKGVILVEGDAEQILIPALVKSVYGVTLDEIGISLINIGSTGFENIARLFDEMRIKKRCAIVTDLDKSILPLDQNPEEDTLQEKDCRNSEKSGQQRKEKLDEFSKDSEWINVFYAAHTFEVDFLLAGNRREIIETISKEYDNDKAKQEATTALNNKDIAVSGIEVLRLAAKFKKGWFALMLSENINHLTYLPKYVIEAIAFASPHLNQKTILSIVQYRLAKLQEQTVNGDKNDYKKIAAEVEKAKTIEEAIKIFSKYMKDDDAATLISALNKN